MKDFLQNSDYEVAVCGGGIAGVSAALASAREGKKVVLFEKQFMLGGLATAGLVTIYLPICDGFGKQVSFGIAEELLKLSLKYGAEDFFPDAWISENKSGHTRKEQRYMVQYNAQVFAILLEQLLLENGVDIMYGSFVTDVEVKDDKIKTLYVENKSGQTAYKVYSVVDATGDCDIAKFADVKTENFKQGNVLAAWYYFTGKDGYKINCLGAADVPDEEKTETQEKPLVDRRFSGLSGKELSEMICISHKISLNDWLNKTKEDKNTVISTITTTPQIRMTRKIVGEYELLSEEEHKYFEDSVGLISNWKRRGPIYEVPFRTLYNKNVKNLIVAGRCVSTDQVLWDVMRVIPCCAVTGQAAGTAASMTDDFSTLNVKDLQNRLVKNGVVLHEQDL